MNSPQTYRTRRCRRDAPVENGSGIQKEPKEGGWGVVLEGGIKGGTVRLDLEKTGSRTCHSHSLHIH